MDETKLKEIKSAEDEAKKIVEDGKKQYSQIVHSAGEEGLEYFKKEKIKTKSDCKQLIEKYRKEGEAEAEFILSTLDNEIKNIQSNFKKNKSKAVDYIRGELKSRYGNS